MLPRRVGSYSQNWLDELCTSGELVWIGAGAIGRSDGRVALYFREDVRLAGPPPSNAKLERPEGPVHDAIRQRLEQGPTFWLDIVAELDHAPEELHSAIWDLAFAGEIDQRLVRAAQGSAAEVGSEGRIERAVASRAAVPRPARPSRAAGR